MKRINIFWIGIFLTGIIYAQENAILMNSTSGCTATVGGSTISLIYQQAGSSTSSVGIGTCIPNTVGNGVGQLVLPGEGQLCTEGFAPSLIVTSAVGGAEGHIGGAIVWSKMYDDLSGIDSTAATNSFFIAGPSESPTGNYYMGLLGSIGVAHAPTYICTITGQPAGTGGIGLQGTFHYSSNVIVDDSVGIGISNPSAKLQVYGGVLWLTYGTGANLGTNAGTGLIEYYDHINDYGVIDAWDYTSGSAKNLLFQLNGGDIGVGTLSPTAQLHTTGSVRFAGLTLNDNATRTIVSDGNGNLYYKVCTCDSGSNEMLAESVRELKDRLQRTEQDNQTLKEQLNDICSGGCSNFPANKGFSQDMALANKLLQNTPNPFSQQTTIGYVINTGNTACLVINGIDGKQIKRIELSVNGAGSVVINSSEMASGTYTYTLVVDDKIVDTKLMVISAKN